MSALSLFDYNKVISQ